MLCRQDDATVFVVAFRVRSERVLRRSAVGPEPGRGQGLGAPWTPALLTRCEWPGREYHVSLPAPIAYSVLWTFRPRSYVVDYFGPREPIRGCETARPRSFLARAERTFSRSCGRGVTASALRHFETVASSARASAARRGHRGQR